MPVAFAASDFSSQQSLPATPIKKPGQRIGRRFGFRSFRRANLLLEFQLELQDGAQHLAHEFNQWQLVDQMVRHRRRMHGAKSAEELSIVPMERYSSVRSGDFGADRGRSIGGVVVRTG